MFTGFPLRFENVSIVNSPISKSLFCDFLNLKGLNESFNVPCICHQTNFTHRMTIPPMGIRQHPTYIIFHLRNISDRNVTYNLKRKKLCDCPLQEARMGINKFRLMHSCLHRWVLCAQPINGQIKANELKQIVFIVNYYREIEDVNLQFQLFVSDDFKLDLFFQASIVGFNPIKCIIQMPLGPLDICDYDTFVQPIWIHNFNNYKYCFKFTSDERRLQILNPILCIDKNEVKPILIKYRPIKEKTELRMFLGFQTYTHPFTVEVNARRDVEKRPIVKCFDTDVLTAVEMPFRIYKNTLHFDMARNDSAVQMIAVHNDSDKCYRFQWINCYQPGFFDVLIQPESFEIKKNHTVLCLVHVKTYANPSIFDHVFISLEIHRKLNRVEKIARKEVPNAESIDDINLYLNTCIMTVILDVNIKIKSHSKMRIMDIYEIKNIADEIIDVPSPLSINRSVLENIFWKFIFEGNFIEDSKNWRKRMPTYEEIFDCGNDPRDRMCKKSIAKDVMRVLMSISLIGISRQWRFVPLDIATNQTINYKTIV